jgi:Fe2+ or Zn2+ uptake regulation protein
MTRRPPTLDDDTEKKRREAIKRILEKMPKASISQVHTEVVRQGLHLSRSTVYSTADGARTL